MPGVNKKVKFYVMKQVQAPGCHWQIETQSFAGKAGRVSKGKCCCFAPVIPLAGKNKKIVC